MTLNFTTLAPVRSLCPAGDLRRRRPGHGRRHRPGHTDEAAPVPAGACHQPEAHSGTGLHRGCRRRRDAGWGAVYPAAVGHQPPDVRENPPGDGDLPAGRNPPYSLHGHRWRRLGARRPQPGPATRPHRPGRIGDPHLGQRGAHHPDAGPAHRLLRDRRATRGDIDQPDGAPGASRFRLRLRQVSAPHRRRLRPPLPWRRWSLPDPPTPARTCGWP